MAKKATKPHKAGKKETAVLKGAEQLKAAKKGLTGQIAKPSGVLVGLVVSSVASNLMDKIPFLKTSEEDDGKFSVKKIIKPLILVAVGTTTAIVTRKKTGVVMEFVNGLGYGVAGGGLLSGVKAATGKSLVSGLGNAGMGKSVLEASYYKHQANDMAKMLAEKKFTPNLPSSERQIENQPKGTEDKEGAEEMSSPKDWGDSLDAESSATII